MPRPQAPTRKGDDLASRARAHIAPTEHRNAKKLPNTCAPANACGYETSSIVNRGKNEGARATPAVLPGGVVSPIASPEQQTAARTAIATASWDCNLRMSKASALLRFL